MKERPILFSAPMVVALRENRKTQTRRTRGLDAINAAPDAWRLMEDAHQNGMFLFRSGDDADGAAVVRCPYGVAGDRLYSRETWAPFDQKAIRDQDVSLIFYRADDTRKLETDGTWRPSIHMPRWASRDTLEVVSARPERLQAITKADAIAEGIPPVTYGDGPLVKRGNGSILLYADLWDSINGTGAWGKNPWVWRVEFRRAEK